MLRSVIIMLVFAVVTIIGMAIETNTKNKVTAEPVDPTKTYTLAVEFVDGAKDTLIITSLTVPYFNRDGSITTTTLGESGYVRVHAAFVRKCEIINFQ